MWVTTAGTTTAERLDTITERHDITATAATPAAVTPTTATSGTVTPTAVTAESQPPATSDFEELLTIVLIQHALNTRPMEYHHDDTTWDRAAEQLDDPPPF